ncbi:MAG TPA: response regulator [Polyangia bacterium]|jgi:CheY-like chemotaxis protein
MPGEKILVIDDSPTILKVVQLVLTKAGYQVETAADGDLGVEAAKEHKPDLILLDFVMPKMNGYQVCRALAEEEALKDLPVVLMSAKGDQIGERFVKVMGIVDYITKPFSPEAITAVVGHTITKYQQRAQAASPAEILPPSPEPAEAPAPLASDAADAAARVRRQALGALRTGIARAVVAKLPVEPGEELPPEAHPMFGSIENALDDNVLEGLLGQLHTASPELAGGDDHVLSGEVRVVPLAQVLQLLQDQIQTGILTVSRGPARVDVFFRQGKVEFASAAGVSEEFLLGRFIVNDNLMAKQDLDTLLKSRSGTGQLLGAQLVKLGYITQAELKQAMARQTAELIYEVLRWSAGRFVFRSTKELPAMALDANLGLTIEGILMEGFRRVDEWHLIEREIDNFDSVFVRNEDAVGQMGKGRLTREELAILEFVNGKNTVKEITRQSRMSSFDVSKMLYRLLSIKLIRKRVAPVAV